jgi:hypothetical protein
MLHPDFWVDCISSLRSIESLPFLVLERSRYSSSTSTYFLVQVAQIDRHALLPFIHTYGAPKCVPSSNLVPHVVVATFRGSHDLGTGCLVNVVNVCNAVVHCSTNPRFATLVPSPCIGNSEDLLRSVLSLVLARHSLVINKTTHLRMVFMFATAVCHRTPCEFRSPSRPSRSP